MASTKWQIEPTSGFTVASEWYSKKRPRELVAVLNNLSRYLAQLNNAKNANCVHAGYIHNEPKGVKAVDQSAGGPALQETRLYVYPDDAKNVLYLITIGNKNEQADDIKLASKFAESIKAHPAPST